MQPDRQFLSDLLAQGENQKVQECLDQLSDPGLGATVSLLLRGVALQQSGHLEQAVVAYSQAADMAQGDLLTLWNNLAAANYHLDRFADAVESVETLRQYKPFDCDLLALHVLSLLGMGRKREALEVAREFVERIPRSAKSTRWAMNALGANRCYLEGLLRASDIPLADWKSSGAGHQLLQWLCELDLADVAEQLFPLVYGPDCDVLDDIETCFTAASIAFSRFDLDRARALYEAGMARGYSDRSARMNLAFIELRQGRFAAGWDLYRARGEDPNYHRAVENKAIPRWNGEPLNGKTIVVSSEQGIGDMIQLLRFIPCLEQMGARVVFAAYPDVVGLLRNDPRARQEKIAAFAVEEIDYYTLMMDLPHFLGIKTPIDIPREIPYLFANREKSAFWREQLAEYEGVRVGIVWAGNPEHGADHCRSATINNFAPLAGLPGVTFFGLQKGEGAKEAKCPPEGLNYIWLGDRFANFEDTAAAIDNLDLIIAVDTSVVHLAGAMGKEVWLLDALRSPEWRWADFGEGNAWYPSVKVFRQEVVDDWYGLLRDRIRPELARRVLERGEHAQPVLEMLQLDAGFLAWEKVDWTAWAAASAAADFSGAVTAWLARSFMERDIKEPLLALSAVLAKTGCFPELAVLAARREMKHGDALAAVARALELKSRHGAEVLSRAAWADLCAFCANRGEHEVALAYSQMAIEAYPRDGHLHYLQGLAQRDLNEPDKAAVSLRRAIDCFPRHFMAYVALAGVLKEKSPVEAWAMAQKAAMLKSANLDVWNFVVSLLHDRGMYWLAEGILLTKGDVRGNFASRTLYLRELLMQGRRQEWEQVFAHTSSGSSMAAKNELDFINMAFAGGQSEKALTLMEDFLQRQPGMREARFTLGFNQLRLGMQKEGWRNYWLSMRRDGPKHFAEWKGEDLTGKTLLIFQDQGQGDMIQFFPLLEDVWQRGPRRMVVAVSPALVTLFRAQNPPFEIVNAEKLDWEDYRYDFQVEYMALPYLLGVDLLHPCHQQPTLCNPIEWQSPWRERIQNDANLRVGIVWSGGDLFKANYVRSTSLTDWSILWAIDGISFYSLQKDIHSNQAAVFDYPLHNLAVDCPTWLETLAAVESLDLVITTCTAVAHLAGSINKPVWILLSNEYVDYRWLQDREDSPWYPSARLFRRQMGESWPQVLERVGTALVETYDSLQWREA